MFKSQQEFDNSSGAKHFFKTTSRRQDSPRSDNRVPNFTALITWDRVCKLGHNCPGIADGSCRKIHCSDDEANRLVADGKAARKQLANASLAEAPKEKPMRQRTRSRKKKEQQ